MTHNPVTREQKLDAALRRAIGSAGCSLNCRSVVLFNDALRGGAYVTVGASGEQPVYFRTQCDCWRKQAQEALDG